MNLSTFSLPCAALTAAIILTPLRPVLAADCSDVLRDPVMNESDFDTKESYYLDKIISINNKQTNSNQQGLDISYDGFTLGYNDQQNSANQLNESYNLSILASEQTHYRLFTGASRIIDAWTLCMNRQGGPAVRFVPQGGPHKQ